MALKGRPIAVGTTDTDIYTCPATTEASVHGLVFANGTGSSASITVKVYIQSTGTTTTVISGQTVAANTSYTWPKPVNLNAGDKIVASASAGTTIVCLYSVYEGTATPVAVGFTPRGAWSSGATYAVNDVVSLSGSSYLAIQAGINQNPATQTAYWLLLASKGDTGPVDPTTSNTFTAAQTFRAANAIRSEAASTQDAVVIAGRAGGTSSYAVTLTPATLNASRTVTIPDGGANYTLGYLNVPQSGSDKTTSYTLATTDIGEFVGVGTSGSITIPNSTFAAGDIVSIFNNTSGNITITCSITTAYIAGTNTDKDTMTLATRGVATILFISGTVCVVTGNVS